MPYSIVYWIKVYDEAPTDPDKKDTVMRTAQIVSDIEEAIGKSDGEVTDYDVEYADDGEGEGDWTFQEEEALRALSANPSKWNDELELLGIEDEEDAATIVDEKLRRLSS